MLKWAFSLALVLIVALGCALVLLHEGKVAARDLARDTAAAVAGILHLQPQVSVRNAVWVQQSRDVLQLTTQELALVEETDFTSTYLGSTKRLRVRGQFVVKAGFDLRKDFRVALSGDGKSATASFPVPEILSVELGKYEALADESGWWNALTPEDRAGALATLQAEARREAVQAGILAKAEAALTAQLDAMGRARGQGWTVEFRAANPEVSVPETTLKR